MMGLVADYLNKQMQQKMMRDEFEKRRKQIDQANALQMSGALQMSPLMTPAQQQSLSQYQQSQMPTLGDYMKQELNPMQRQSGILGNALKLMLL